MLQAPQISPTSWASIIFIAGRRDPREFAMSAALPARMMTGFRLQRSGHITLLRRTAWSLRPRRFHWTGLRLHLSKQDQAPRLTFTSSPRSVATVWRPIYRRSHRLYRSRRVLLDQLQGREP